MGSAGTYVLLPVQAGGLQRRARGPAGAGLCRLQPDDPAQRDGDSASSTASIPWRGASAPSTPLSSRMTAPSAASTTTASATSQSLREARPEWRADAGPAVVHGRGRRCPRCAGEPCRPGRQGDPPPQPHRRAGAAAGARIWRPGQGGALGSSPARRSPTPPCWSTPRARACRASRRSTSPLDRLPAQARGLRHRLYPARDAAACGCPQRGNRTVNGLGMLLHQARPAFNAWFGVMPEVTAELRAMIEATL